MTPTPEETTPATTSDPIDWGCTRCHSQLQDRGEIEFRVGGSGGGATFLLGGWAELGESKLAMRVLTCPRCGQHAFFGPNTYPLR
jgi:hypothetical protein